MCANKRSRWGHIETIKAGEKYRIFWPSGHKPNGKRAQPSMMVYGTRDDAELKLAQIRLQQGEVLPDMTYEELWGGIVKPSFAKYGLAVRTEEEQTGIWRRELKPRIATDVVAETTSFYVESKIAEIESPWVQRSTFALWRKMINLAKHHGLKMENPCDRYVYRKKAEAEEKPILHAHDVKEWMESIRGIKQEAVLLAEVGSGLRVEEGCALVGEDFSRFDKDGRVYLTFPINKALVSSKHGRTLKEPKNKFSKRELVIGEPFSKRLLEILPDIGPLCPSGKPWQAGEYEAAHYASPAEITKRYKAWCEKKGIAYINPGKLRKSWSVMQDEAGSKDSVISLAMGHAEDTTRGMNYQRLTRRQAIALADALTNLIEYESMVP